MPNDDLPQPSAVAEPAVPLTQPTTTQTRPTLHDLFTGGWKRPLAGLPTALGRPLARLGAAGRTTWHRRVPGGGMHQ